MRAIAMINQKGGVGKTTTAVNVAAALARRNKRILLVDLDPQSHATMHLGIEPDGELPGSYDVLTGGAQAADTVREIDENLALIPAHIDLVGVDVELARRPDREMVLRHALEPMRERFDVLIIDCPPSLGTLTVNALAAVDEVFIPLQPHFLALQGLGRLLETVSLVRGVLNPALRISGIALCLYERGTRLAQEVESDVRQFVADASPEDAWHGARVFETRIRRNVKLAECPSFGKTIFDYAARSRGAKDYEALACEILAMTAEDTPSDKCGPDQGVSTASPGRTAVVAQAARPADAVVPPGSRAALEGSSGTPNPVLPSTPPDSCAAITAEDRSAK
jgi:chromosome partitioning protein